MKILIKSGCQQVDIKSPVVEATHYYPFGLPMAISTGANVQKYKYSGKEFDTEHGLMEYDFGARMYNPQILSTMTMDPHCENYYFTSPYSWCKNNPVNRIDPTGMDDYEIDIGSGKLKKRKENKDQDVFFLITQNQEGDFDRMKDSEGNDVSLSFAAGTVWEGKSSDGYEAYTVKGNNNGTKLFEFLADNSKVEWGNIQNTFTGTSTLVTSHETSEITLDLNLFQFGTSSVTHSHPSGTPYPSGLDNRRGDIGAAQTYEKRYGSHIQSYIYLPGQDKNVRETYIPYNSKSQIWDFRGHPLNITMPDIVISPRR
jgi:RHS repeat-associated protein